MKGHLSTRDWILLSIASVLLSVVSAQSMGAIGNQASPTVIAPCGVPLFVIAIFFSGGTPIAAALLVALPFFFVERRLMVDPLIPVKLTGMIVGIVAALSLCLFAVSWNDGLRYEGPQFTVGTAILDAVFVVVLSLLLFCMHRRKSPRTQLLLHFVFAAWIVTYAFPWLGETL
jgi:hypothetical protein